MFLHECLTGSVDFREGRCQALVSRCRGKLYILSEDSAWQEAGIGHASIVGAGTHRRLQFKAEDSPAA